MCQLLAREHMKTITSKQYMIKIEPITMRQFGQTRYKQAPGFSRQEAKDKNVYKKTMQIQMCFDLVLSIKKVNIMKEVFNKDLTLSFWGH